MASKLGFTRTNNEELRIVMVGKTGTGKSATGNNILGQKCFESKFSAKSMTVDCSKGRAVVDGQHVAVIDTPGLFDTRFGFDKTTNDVSQCISYASPGPHVFLVVIRLGRYTTEEMHSVQRIQEIFGQAADRYSMVLFTGGDQLEDTTIEDFVDESSELQELVGRCNGQYHVFNNKLKDTVESHSQVTELLQKIRNITQKNRGSHYTNEMFQEAERKLEEEQQRILKEKEKIRKEKEEMEKILQKKYEKQMEKIYKQFQAEKEREQKEREEENKRQRAEWNEERQNERKERERERQKEREEREKERTNIMKEMKEQHEREQSEQSKKLQSKYEKEARREAEVFNILPFLGKLGEIIVDRIKGIGTVFGERSDI